LFTSCSFQEPTSRSKIAEVYSLPNKNISTEEYVLHSHLSLPLQNSAELVSSAHAWLNPWSHSKIQEASSLSRDLTAIDRGQHGGAEN